MNAVYIVMAEHYYETIIYAVTTDKELALNIQRDVNDENPNGLKAELIELEANKRICFQSFR